MRFDWVKHLTYPYLSRDLSIKNSGYSFLMIKLFRSQYSTNKQRLSSAFQIKKIAVPVRDLED